MVRCFVGIFLPDSLKSKVLELQYFLKSLDIDCKLVEPENLHITLSFLGELDTAGIETTKQNLDEICSNFREFTISISGIKFIPNKNYVRVIALDITDASEMFPRILNELKQNISGDAKPPHLTLCRVRKMGKKDALSKLQNVDSYCGEFRVSSIQLIESQLGGSGPAYSVLHESKFL